MIKPLSITSPTHAWALTTYFILGFSGLAGLFNFSSQSTVMQSMGPIADVWSTIIMLSGFGSFFAAIAASRALRPEYNLASEMSLNVAMFVSLIYFFYMTVYTAGLKGFTTAVFALVFILGSGMRAWQIKHELNLIKSARIHPTDADPDMGDPSGESDEE